jgi:trimeric autotransporter adhesin
MAITNQEIVKAIKAGGVVTSLGELAAGDAITLKGDGGSETGQITLNNAGNTAGTVLKSGAVSSSITFTLPTAHGSNGQVLSTNGSGALSFSDDTGITLTAARGGISVTTSSASGGGTLAYTSSTGVLDFAPADLSTFITASSTDTLTNKTLTTPVITSVTSGGNAITFPNSAIQTLAGLAEVQKFTAANRGDVATVTPTGGPPEVATMDLNAKNNFAITTGSNAVQLTFSNVAAAAEGQSGNIYLDNSNGKTISKNALILMSDSTTTLGTISAAGKYWLSYLVISSSNVAVAATKALT